MPSEKESGGGFSVEQQVSRCYLCSWSVQALKSFKLTGRVRVWVVGVVRRPIKGRDPVEDLFPFGLSLKARVLGRKSMVVVTKECVGVPARLDLVPRVEAPALQDCPTIVAGAAKGLPNDS